MKLLVINNLSSGYGEGAVYDFVRSFARDGDEVCMRSTDGTTPVETLVEGAQDYDAVIACWRTRASPCCPSPPAPPTCWH